MANLNFIGSLSERKMRFASTTEVVATNDDNLFYAMSIYIPKRFARLNIVDWNDAYVTSARPALFTAVVDNYARLMKGDLLTQWQPIFRQDTNSEVVLYLIVFDDGVQSGWETLATEISYEPLTEAFNALFPFSYFKFMFDPTFDGATVRLPAAAGTSAKMRVVLANESPQGSFAKQKLQFRNGASLPVTLADGAYTLNDGSKVWNILIPQPVQLAAAGGMVGNAVGGSNGPDENMVIGQNVKNFFNPVLPDGLSATVQNVTQGIVETTGVRVIEVANASGASIDITAGTYTITDHASKTYSFTVAATVSIADGSSQQFSATATSSGADADWTAAGNVAIPIASISGLDSGLTAAQVDASSIAGVNGSPTEITVSITNISATSKQLTAGSYSINSGASGDPTYSLTVATNTAMQPGGLYEFNAQAATIGSDPMLTEGADLSGLFVPALPAGMVCTGTGVVQGLDAGAGSPITISAGQYVYTDGVKHFPITLTTSAVLQPNAVSADVEIQASVEGEDSALAAGHVDGSLLSPALPVGINLIINSVTQGSNPIPQPTDVPSMYWDLSLALAQLCKNNIALSWFWTMVKISYVDKQPNPQDACWVRYKSRAEQIQGMTSLQMGDRAKYYWAALYLMNCFNTCMIVHSEPTYIIADIFACWFAEKNESRTYIGNKMSLLRLTGPGLHTGIKPLGWPSWIDESVNENDSGVMRTPTGDIIKGQDHLDSLNVGYLETISSNSIQDCVLSMARGIGDPDKGIPVTMQMISKYVDYTCSQEAANWISDSGTLIRPILTDETAYTAIQSMVSRNLMRFGGTNGRVYGVQLLFPDFEEAKVSRTMLSAATAWKGYYKDDLDEVEVSGGLVAQ